MMNVADQDGVAKVKDISRAGCTVSRRTSRTSVNPHLKEFLQNTSLHGVKYIGNGNIHWLERLFWCSVLIACSISLVTVGRMKWFQWRETPMTIERANAPHHISTLPIPAITFCGESIFDREVLNWETKSLQYMKLRQILESNMETNPDIVDSVYKLVDIVNDGPFNYFFKINNTENSIGTKFKITTSRFEEIMSELYATPTFISLGRKDGTNKWTYCIATFTSKGFCTTCNMFPPSKLYKNTTVHHSIYSLLRDQELINDTIHGFPLLNDLLDKHSGLQYPMKVGDLDKWNSFNVDGYINMYALHNPWDIPSPFMRWHQRWHDYNEIRVIGLDRYDRYRRPNPILQINIEPELTLQYSTDDNLMNKISHTNQCYSTTGKELEFFQYYTQQNCLLECLARKMLKECGCVMFYMPHYETTHICSTKNRSCELKVNKDMYDITDENSINYCDCLPNCNSTEYKVISIEEYNSHRDSFSNRRKELRVMFRDDFFYPRFRNYTYNKYYMIESAIFYLDIFLGISMLTIVEIFYYLVLYVVDCFKC